MTEPIYIVSGFPRSGTSMMMRALEAGGIPCVYSPAGDANRNRNTLIPGYVPNPHGFYEDADLTPGVWSNYRGKAVKVIRDDLSFLPAGERLRGVYMRRDPAEIRRSYVGILSGPYGESAFSFLDDYESKVASDVARLGAIVLDYADVVADPWRELARLDWPINLSRAAMTVDPALYRHRGAA